MFLSLPFSRILTPNELRAIVAHELGHFKGWDTRFSEAFAPVYRGALESLASLRAEIEEGVSGLPLLPAFYVLRFFLDAFDEAVARLNRARELAADRVAAAATDERVTAAALVKVHAFHRYWRRALAVLREKIARAERDLNAAVYFARAAADNRGSAWMRKDLDEEEPPHPTDSHPPLSRRLQALGLAIQDVAGEAFAVEPAEPASGLFERPEELEQRLTGVEKAILIERRQVWEGSAKF
jgi:Zn-dependent protease with chaperone function